MLPGSNAEPVAACCAGAGTHVTSSCAIRTTSINRSARADAIAVYCANRHPVRVFCTTSPISSSDRGSVS